MRKGCSIELLNVNTSIVLIIEKVWTCHVRCIRESRNTNNSYKIELLQLN